MTGGSHRRITLGGVALFEVTTTEGITAEIRLVANYCPDTKSILISTGDRIKQGFDIHLRQPTLDTPSTEEVLLGSFCRSPRPTCSIKQYVLATTNAQVNNKECIYV